MKTYLIIIFVLLCSQIVLAGPAQVNNVVTFGPIASPFAIVPLESMTSGTGASSPKALFKVLPAYATTSTNNGFEGFVDPATGTYYLSAANTAVEILGYCIMADTAFPSSAYQFQIGFSTGTITQGNATAPSGPVYGCGGNTIRCLPSVSSANVSRCDALHMVVPTGNYIWFQHGAVSAGAQVVQLYIREF